MLLHLRGETKNLEPPNSFKAASTLMPVLHYRGSPEDPPGELEHSSTLGGSTGDPQGILYSVTDYGRGENSAAAKGRDNFVPRRRRGRRRRVIVV